jgi:acetyl esterase/lipase
MVSGFSAGGHLAASLAVHWNKPFITDALGGSSNLYKPNGAVLCYPVITSGEKRHDGSIVNIVSTDYPAEIMETVSLEKQVSDATPPVFIWHTAEDGAVPVQNALIMGMKLKEKNIPFEMHIFPEGPHGVALFYDAYPYPTKWAELCVNWLRHIEL